jgi:hypothetical protein
VLAEVGIRDPLVKQGQRLIAGRQRVDGQGLHRAIGRRKIGTPRGGLRRGGGLTCSRRISGSSR